MANSDVIKAWVREEACSSQNLSTDGISLWSYRLKIGDTICGKKVVYDHTSNGLGFVSRTTSKHVGLAKYECSK